MWCDDVGKYGEYCRVVTGCSPRRRRQWHRCARCDRWPSLWSLWYPVVWQVAGGWRGVLTVGDMELEMNWDRHWCVKLASQTKLRASRYADTMATHSTFVLGQGLGLWIIKHVSVPCSPGSRSSPAESKAGSNPSQFHFINNKESKISNPQIPTPPFQKRLKRNRNMRLRIWDSSKFMLYFRHSSTHLLFVHSRWDFALKT